MKENFPKKQQQYEIPKGWSMRDFFEKLNA